MVFFMQLYAIDEKGEDVIAHQAQSRQKYHCIECMREVRVRSGPFIRPHFFHLKENTPCRLREKSPTHLEIQAHLQHILPGTVTLEKRFSSLNRIADVVWENEKIIFEVQVSFITAQEVAARSQAYRSLGYEIIWILHDHRFNTYRVTAAEHALLSHPHYFTDINAEGRGSFFDQYSYHLAGTRAARLFRRPVDLTQPKRSFTLPDDLPPQIASHRQHWTISFKGDLLNSPHLDPRHLQKAADLELLYKKPHPSFSLRKKVKDFFRFIGYLMMDGATR